MYIKVEIFLFVVAMMIMLAVHQAKEKQELTEGLESCIENVKKKCGPVVIYASDLERENSKLRKILKKCRDSKN